MRLNTETKPGPVRGPLPRQRAFGLDMARYTRDLSEIFTARFVYEIVAFAKALNAHRIPGAWHDGPDIAS
jgi:hypothetical protein